MPCLQNLTTPARSRIATARHPQRKLASYLCRAPFGRRKYAGYRIPARLFIISTLNRPLQDNDAVLFIDRKGRRYLKTLRAGRMITIRGEIAAEALFGLDDGSRVRLSSGENF